MKLREVLALNEILSKIPYSAISNERILKFDTMLDSFEKGVKHYQELAKKIAEDLKLEVKDNRYVGDNLPQYIEKVQAVEASEYEVKLITFTSDEILNLVVAMGGNRQSKLALMEYFGDKPKEEVTTKPVKYKR